jgi:ERCC4-type nuclease
MNTHYHQGRVKMSEILVIDDREIKVEKSIESLKNNGKYTISTLKKRITTGDFAIVRNKKILAVFERKTLNDYSASIKDGRHQNKQKMIDMRSQTNCDVYYIVESPFAFPSKKRKFQKMPYKNIYSSIINLMVRDNIMVIKSQSVEDTAEILCDFVMSYRKFADLPKFCDVMAEGAEEKPAENQMDKPAEKQMDKPVEKQMNNIENIQKNEPLAPIGAGAVDLLREPKHKTMEEIITRMWCAIPWISEKSAEIMVKLYSIREICTVFTEVQKKEIQNIKYLDSNRKLSAKTVKVILSLQNNIKVQEKILAIIPGISDAMAKNIIVGYKISEIDEASELCLIKNGKRNLSKKLCDKIKELISYKST